jgi:hypothetical protein
MARKSKTPDLFEVKTNTAPCVPAIRAAVAERAADKKGNTKSTRNVKVPQKDYEQLQPATFGELEALGGSPLFK